MNIQIFGTRKCRDTQKAIRFFKERRIKVHFVDLNEKPLSRGELDNITRSVPVDDLLDREGKQFQYRQLQYMKFDPYEEILEDPFLIKTPIVRYKGKAVVGLQPEIWQGWIDEEK